MEIKEQFKRSKMDFNDTAMLLNPKHTRQNVFRNDMQITKRRYMLQIWPQKFMLPVNYWISNTVRSTNQRNKKHVCNTLLAWPINTPWN